jgi:uncharacterized membrane protein YqiK
MLKDRKKHDADQAELEQHRREAAERQQFEIMWNEAHDENARIDKAAADAKAAADTKAAADAKAAKAAADAQAAKTAAEAQAAKALALATADAKARKQAELEEERSPKHVEKCLKTLRSCVARASDGPSTAPASRGSKAPAPASKSGKSNYEIEAYNADEGEETYEEEGEETYEAEGEETYE